MQNKPNFRKSQMNVNKVLTKDYEKRTLGERGKTNPIQTQSKPIQSQLKPIKCQNKPKQTQSNPISNGRGRKKLVFQPLVSYKMQQTGNRKFNASEAVFGADSIGTI
jgi:hypothetical protein